MAKKSTVKRNGVNKSQAIRETYSKLGRNARPRDIIAALGDRGIEVSPALVTNVISRQPKKGKRARVAVATRSRASNGSSVSVAALIEAKRLVTEVGSVDAARRALETLSKLL